LQDTYRFQKVKKCDKTSAELNFLYFSFAESETLDSFAKHFRVIMAQKLNLAYSKPD
jgi:hypothetical protein